MKHSFRACTERAAIGCMAAVLAVGCVGGCAGERQIVEGPAYPASIVRNPSLDIQVFRRETEIEFTNTTARAYGPFRMWLNGWYSREFKNGLAVGETRRVPLKEFTDQYGDRFRGGGFFATERAEMLALAEMEVDGTMMGLVVVGGDEP